MTPNRPMRREPATCPPSGVLSFARLAVINRGAQVPRIHVPHFVSVMSRVSPTLSKQERKLQVLYRLIGVPFHPAVALLAFVPYFFSWTGVASVLLGHLLITLFGVNIGYHRLLAHLSISCSKGLERALAALGVLNVQFGPAYWVAIHRRHHHMTDVPGDPHSPRDGFWKSHLFFLYPLT